MLVLQIQILAALFKVLCNVKPAPKTEPVLLSCYRLHFLCIYRASGAGDDVLGIENYNFHFCYFVDFLHFRVLLSKSIDTIDNLHHNLTKIKFLFDYL